MQSSYENFFKRVVKLLKSTGFDYLIIGGLAVNILGEARMTEDIDLILYVREKDIDYFLQKAKKSKLQFNKKIVQADIKTRRTFKILFENYHLDIILSSTKFEDEALKRKKEVTIWKYKVFLPTPEDLIVLKIIPGRPKDLLDAESVYIKNKQSIDVKYIERWAQWFTGEAQDMTIYNNYKKVISGKLF